MEGGAGEPSGARPVAVPGAGVDAFGRCGRQAGPRFRAGARRSGNVNVFAAAADHIEALQAAGKRVMVAAWTEGSAERMGGVLSDHGLAAHPPASTIGPKR